MPCSFAPGRRAAVLTNLLLALLFAPLIALAPLPTLPAVQAAALPAAVDIDQAALEQLAAALQNGQAQDVVGLYVPGQFAFPVVQQPLQDAGFVSTRPNETTQFRMAQQYGVTGILAHNTLAGGQFQNLAAGDTIVVIYGDGHWLVYTVRQIARYQALTPDSVFSNFVNLDAPAETQTAASLFHDVYAHEGRLVLQTCIASAGNSGWGRLFVIAEPMLPASPQPESALFAPFFYFPGLPAWSVSPF